MEKLRQAPAFTEEVTTEQYTSVDGTPKGVLRVKASDLYVPSDVFRSIGLPIIDWRDENGEHAWRSDSEEGTPTQISLPITDTLPSQVPVRPGFEMAPTGEIYFGYRRRGWITGDGRPELLP